MWNPIRKVKNAAQLIKIYRRADRLLDHLNTGVASHERAKRDPMSKSILKSKVFWFNTITLTLKLAEVLPIPTEYIVLILGIGNVLLRFLTENPVHLTFQPAPKE